MNHKCISEVLNPEVDTRFSPRGDSREGIPNIWIIIGEGTAHSSSKFITPLRVMISRIFWS